MIETRSLKMNDINTRIKVHIVARDVRKGDAIGNFVLDIYSMLKNIKIDSLIFAENYSDYRGVNIEPIKSFNKFLKTGDIILYHFSIFDPFINDICKMENKKICYYHGITPPELLEKFDPITSELCRLGLEQVSILNEFDVILCNSQYSVKQLEKKIAFKEKSKSIKICPPMIFSQNTNPHSNPIMRSDFGVKKLIYVGRISPHKKIEDLLRFFKEFHKIYKKSELHIIGKGENERYNKYLNCELKKIPIEAAKKIFFDGHISDDEVNAAYRSADLFVTMSEHEGFCVPLFEAMHYDLPIIACKFAAIPETLGDTGVLFDKRDFLMAAKKIKSIIDDQDTLINVLSKQMKRYVYLKDLSNGNIILDAIINLNNKNDIV